MSNDELDHLRVLVARVHEAPTPKSGLKKFLAAIKDRFFTPMKQPAAKLTANAKIEKHVRKDAA